MKAGVHARVLSGGGDVLPLQWHTVTHALTVQYVARAPLSHSRLVRHINNA